MLLVPGIFRKANKSRPLNLLFTEDQADSFDRLAGHALLLRNEAFPDGTTSQKVE
jgi:hypothetical protein